MKCRKCGIDSSLASHRRDMRDQGLAVAVFGRAEPERKVGIRGTPVHHRMLVHALRGDAFRNLLRHRGVNLAQRRLALAVLKRLQQVVSEVAVMELGAFERLLVHLAGGHHDAAGSIGHVRQHFLRRSLGDDLL